MKKKNAKAKVGDYVLLESIDSVGRIEAVSDGIYVIGGRMYPESAFKKIEKGDAFIHEMIYLMNKYGASLCKTPEAEFKVDGDETVYVIGNTDLF